jgi:peroxin-6
MSLLSQNPNAHPPGTEPLTEVVLDALSDTAYRVAIDNPELVERALLADNADIHLGSLHQITLDQLQNGLSTHSPLQYRTIMLEPTSHGRLDPCSTKIIITRSGEPHLLLSTDTLSESIDSEGIEIDEDFLANAVVPGHFKPKQHNENNDSSDAVHSKQASFRAESLAFPAYPTEDHCTLYVRTSDLGRVGLLNEDWVGSAVSYSVF